MYRMKPLLFAAALLAAAPFAGCTGPTSARIEDQGNGRWCIQSMRSSGRTQVVSGKGFTMLVTRQAGELGPEDIHTFAYWGEKGGMSVLSEKDLKGTVWVDPEKGVLDLRLQVRVYQTGLGNDIFAPCPVNGTYPLR